MMVSEPIKVQNWYIKLVYKIGVSKLVYSRLGGWSYFSEKSTVRVLPIGYIFSFLNYMIYRKVKLIAVIFCYNQVIKNVLNRFKPQMALKALKYRKDGEHLPMKA